MSVTRLPSLSNSGAPSSSSSALDLGSHIGLHRMDFFCGTSKIQLLREEYRNICSWRTSIAVSPIQMESIIPNRGQMQQRAADSHYDVGPNWLWADRQSLERSANRERFPRLLRRNANFRQDQIARLLNKASMHRMNIHAASPSVRSASSSSIRCISSLALSAGTLFSVGISKRNLRQSLHPKPHSSSSSTARRAVGIAVRCIPSSQTILAEVTPVTIGQKLT